MRLLSISHCRSLVGLLFSTLRRYTSVSTNLRTYYSSRRLKTYTSLITSTKVCCPNCKGKALSQTNQEMNSPAAFVFSPSVPPPTISLSRLTHGAACTQGAKRPTMLPRAIGGRHWKGASRRNHITRSAYVQSDVPKLERMSQEELERIMAFRPPNLVPPKPFRRNLFAETAKAEAFRWAEEHSLLHEIYRSPEELQAYYKADYPELAMLIYVDCGETEAAWAAKYYTWAIIFDDTMDYITNFSLRERSVVLFLELYVMLMWSFPDDKQVYKNFVDFLDEGELVERTQALNYVHLKLDEARLKPGTIYNTSSPEVHPLCKAFRDLWAPLCEKTPADFLRRWTLLFQDQLLGNVKEVRNRKYNNIPPVDNYIACRRDTIAVLTSLVVVEYLNQVYLPDEVFDRPEMERFLYAAADVLTLQNDLRSFKKEALVGEVNNLVIILSRTQDCSYEEAGIKVYQMMLDKVADMKKAIYDLKKVTPPEYQHAISVYANSGWDTFSGSYYWYLNCVRYLS